MLEKAVQQKAGKMARNGANYAMIVQRLRREGVDQLTAEMCAAEATRRESALRRLRGLGIASAGMVIVIGAGLVFLLTGRVRLPLSGAMLGLIVTGVGLVSAFQSGSKPRNSREAF